MAADDAYTIALIHTDTNVFDACDDNTWLSNGGDQLGTDQYKFGDASYKMDGTSYYSSTLNTSTKWRLDDGSNNNSWTIDYWVRFNSVSIRQPIIQQQYSKNYFWAIMYTSNKLYFQVYNNGNLILISNSWSPSIDIWYHNAIVKQGTTGYKMFIDGNQIGSTQTSTNVIPSWDAKLYLGTYLYDPKYFNGYIDELRISKGIARWTSNFTPPTQPYGSTISFVPKIIFY